MVASVTVVLLRLLALSLVTALFSCGGGGDGGTLTISPTFGGLRLNISGLPGGVSAAITISGPGFSQSAGASQIFTGLSVGTYTVSAANVTSNGTVYRAQPATQTITIGGGATTDVNIAYSSAPPVTLSLQEVASGLASPLFLTAPGGDARLFIVERPGRIRVVQNGALLGTPFLDITARVDTTGEGGLLSMAFDPQYAANGRFYVYFIDATGDVNIERFQVSSGDANRADPASLPILTVTHRANTNHKGGLIAFGTDGMLYAGIGDGGGAGDPPGNAQNLTVLLGKLLRLDVRNASLAQPYAIPPDNPFAGAPSGREIWAYGLRNPWRYAFDAGAGLLYVADVGQSRREEVDVAPVASGGLNYGWNITEGSLCYPTDPCSKTGFTLPVLEYDHSGSGGCSITGGFVYRGSAIPEIQGRYFYSDFCNGWLRSFAYTNGAATEQTDWSIANVGQILSFGEDGQRELYMLSAAGKVYRIVRG